MTTLPVILDARILAYNDTGIARYVRHLYRAMREVADEGANGGKSGLDVTVLEARRDRAHYFASLWPRRRIALTPPHHSLERFALCFEIAVTMATLPNPPVGRRVVVHSPDHVGPGRYRALRGLRWANVVTVHDLAFLRMPETHSVASRAYYQGLFRTIREVDRIICPSHATRNDLLEFTRCDPAIVRVIPEAPDPRYARREHPTPPRPTDRPYILTVGTSDPRKNVKLIIRALATIAAVDRPQLQIVGADGSATAELRALVSTYHLEEDVAFLGRMSTSSINDLYQNALAAVYVSSYEGFGLPVIEAMAAGAPVITTAVSSLPEVGGDVALYVAPDDVAGLAEAIMRLQDDAALREFCRAGGLARARTFSWHTAAMATIALFDEASRS